MAEPAPTHCDCGTLLVIHCGSVTCRWLRCANARCIWSTWDVERHIRVDRDGNAERLSA